MPRRPSKKKHSQPVPPPKKSELLRRQQAYHDDFMKRLTALRDDAARHLTGSDARDAIEVHYQNLQTAVEELYVMREELLVQNEELSHTYELLNEERQRYRELFDFAPEAYLVTDRSGNITDANHYAAGLLHLELRLFRSKPLSTFIHPQSREQFWQDLASLEVGEATRTFRWRVSPRRRHTPFEAEASAAVVRDRGGRVTSVRWLIRDITPILKASRQLTEYQRRLRALASELSVVEERERRRIAVDIHDRISQNLAMVKMKLASLQAQFSPDTKQRVQADYYDALFLLEQTLDDTRTLTFELSPPILYELGLVAALQWLAEHVWRQYKLKVTVDGPTEPEGIDEDTRTLLFRSVRELLINVVKHANASAALIAVRNTHDGVRITVADDGEGFDHSQLTQQGERGGFGLFSMRTRLEELDGKIEISSVAGAGTRVTLTAPAGKNTSSGSGGGNPNGDQNSPGR